MKKLKDVGNNKHKYDKKYYQKNRKKVLNYQKEWRKNNPDKVKKIFNKCALKREYGISLEDYDKMFEQQNGVCAICGKPELFRRLSIDHNHKTGKVRGLLCMSCNVAIGSFKDNINLLKNAIKYLDKK